MGIYLYIWIYILLKKTSTTRDESCPMCNSKNGLLTAQLRCNLISKFCIKKHCCLTHGVLYYLFWKWTFQKYVIKVKLLIQYHIKSNIN